MNEPDEVAAACLTIARWAVFAAHAEQGPGIPAPSSALLQAFIDRVVFRRRPDLTKAISAVSFLVERSAEVLSNDTMADLLLALARLDVETRLPHEQGASDDLPDEERPEVRAAASTLAATLTRTYFRDDPPEVLRHWRRIGPTDALPEVRQAWWPLAPEAAQP